MRVICSTFGSSGDVFPMLGLAVALKVRGHDVLFATNGHFKENVRRHCLAFEPLGSREQYEATIRDPDLWRPRTALQHVLRSIQPALERQYAIHEAVRPAWAVTNCFGLGARMARDKLGIPLATVHLQPAVFWSDIAPPDLPGMAGPRWLKRFLYQIGTRFVINPAICPFINRWRTDLGLAPVSGLMTWWNSPDLVLGLFPHWYGPPQLDWPPQTVLTGFPLFNDGSADGLIPAAATFLDAGPPPVVFTAGTANRHAAAFFRAAVASCRSLNVRGVFLTQFRDQVPQELPDTVAAFDYVPLDLLLPRASAIVHHGGIGTTAQALAAGIPQLIAPLAHDQFDNAARVARLGAGTAMPSGRPSASRMAALLERIRGPEVVVRARLMADRMRDRGGLSRAAEVIERQLSAASARIDRGHTTAAS
jgi:UDP:flavonoid glycosyltransferase YjiC (YdhE family)